ncbi:hypothetical protein DFP73DRAFT_237133 [Morchella snyderi]|nr:hypothetical protein DFP73DRAFT_237133 [Morchella snyderi]
MSDAEVSAVVSACVGEFCTSAVPFETTSVATTTSDSISTPLPTGMSNDGSSTQSLVTTHVTSTVRPSMVVVTVTTPLNASPTLDIDASPTESATSDENHRSGDTRVVAITIGVVGGLALLILLLYWAANFLASRRYEDEEDRDLEGESARSMLGAASSKTERDTPLPGRPILSRPKRASIIPYARKVVTFDRLSRSSYNNINTKHFSDLLAKRLSAVHPGTKVVYGSPATKASKIVPPRKPVPRAAGHPTPGAQPRNYAPSGTESDYSDDADDVSTVLGGTGKSQNQIQQEATYHPLPPGVPFTRWLNAGRAQELPTSHSRPSSAWQK